jgi:hypothetical protein
VIFIVIAFVQIRVAVTGKFLENIKDAELDRRQRDLFAALGRVGLPARGVVFGLVG